MLSVRPWKLGALLRLGGGVFLCMVLGLVVLEALTYANEPRTAKASSFLLAIALSAGFLASSFVLTRRTWTEENFFPGLALVLACAFGGLVTAGWAQHLLGDATPDEKAASTMIVPVLSLHGAGLVLIAAFLREHRVGWAEAFGFRQRRLRAIGWGIIGWLAGLAGISLLQRFSVDVMDRFHFEAKEQMPVEVVRNAHSWLTIVVLGVLTVVLVPAVEEMLFRGILYPAIKGRGYPRLALWGSAVAFGVVHGNLMGFLPLTFFAVLLVLVYELTGNLLAPILAHGLFNAGGFLALMLAHRSDLGPFFKRLQHWLGG